ncbi:hypothetical protein ACFFSQ_47000 [Dactylosporangium matsuzakiense]|uniref:hypothetical protein n=1 Tax=Dactylosporangium matsuzakiense TaxID=53360 RepID=UPI0031E8817E
MLSVVAAIPAGSRRAHDQAEALRAYDEHPARWEMRSDRDARWRAIWRALVCAADWRTLTYTGTWDVLAERAGVSRSTVARAVRWYQLVGLLSVVHTGATAAAIGSSSNRAPSYVVTVPDVDAGHSPVDELDTPTGGESSLDDQFAREDSGSSALRLESELPTRKPGPSWPMSAAPRTRAERLAAAEALIWHAPTIRRVSPRLVRHVLRTWFAAGWSVSDVLYALDHTPAGVASRITGPVHTPAAWMRYRLAAWLEHGQPMPSRSQRARAAHAALLESRRTRGE